MNEFTSRIKSYVLRQGRMTDAQKYAFAYWPDFGLPLVSLDLTTVFNNQNPVVLEIGFGMGDSLLEQAKLNPNSNFIGIEVHRPGVGNFLAKVKANSLSNVKVFCHDAQEVLEMAIPDGSLAAVQIFFPDPWPKKRHHKRRIIQPAFVELLLTKLQIGGVLHLATDWKEYAIYMQEVMEHAQGFSNHNGAYRFAINTGRLHTKFEKRGINLGHEIFDLIYYKK